MMMRLLLLCSFTTLFLTSAHAAEPEPKVAFAKADAELNALWAKAKAGLSASDFNQLKEDQRVWIEYRDHLALSTTYTGAMTGGKELTRESPEYLEAAADLTQQRNHWLEGLLRPIDEGLTGLWSDSYGGQIEITEDKKKEGFEFSISCARGHSIHIGELDGFADWAYPVGWFKAVANEDPDQPAARLSFVMRGKLLEVTGAHTSPYHGARAYFDGRYVKVGDLPAEEKAEPNESAEELGKK